MAEPRLYVYGLTPEFSIMPSMFRRLALDAPVVELKAPNVLLCIAVMN
jgi:hypothetical protein